MSDKKRIFHDEVKKLHHGNNRYPEYHGCMRVKTAFTNKP